MRNKRRDEEVERLRQEHLARKRKVEEEQRRRRVRMNATIEMNRRRQKARQRRSSNPPSDFTRGDVDDIMENFVDQWTQCAPKDWEVPLSYEKSHLRKIFQDIDIHTRSVCEWQERNYERWQNETEVTVMMISTKRGEISKENVDLEAPLHLDSFDVAVAAHREGEERSGTYL